MDSHVFTVVDNRRCLHLEHCYLVNIFLIYFKRLFERLKHSLNLNLSDPSRDGVVSRLLLLSNRLDCQLICEVKSLRI